MKLQVTCLGENSPDWFTRVQNLALSLRRVPGPLADARMVAHFVTEADPHFAERLERLSVITRVVEPMPGGGPANKLRMFESAPEDDFDLLVALDCDVIVARDFSELPPRDAIGVKAVDFDRLKQRDWRKLCSVAGIDSAGAVALRSTSSGRPMPPYFNSGVITLPRALCSQLKGAWLQSYEWLQARLAEDPHLLPHHLHWFGDQVSLALAIRAAGLPWKELPAGMNVPTHVGARSDAGSGEANPYVLHYHGEIDAEGFLVATTRDPVRGQIQRFNRERAEYLGVPTPVGSWTVGRRYAKSWLRLKRSVRRQRCRLVTRLHDLFEGRSREPKPLRLARR